MTLYLCKSDPNVAGEPKLIAVIGRIVECAGGYRFLPNVTSHKPSRKSWPSANACIPRWAESIGFTELLDKDELAKRQGRPA